MARTGITYDDVVNATELLVAQGEPPTIDRIRALTGTGSKTTIAHHLKVWKARQAQAKQLCQKESLPEALVVTMRGLWERMLDQADEKVEGIKQDLDQTIQTLQAQNKNLEESNARWQQQLQQMKQEKERLSSDKAALEQGLQQFKNEQIALTVRNDDMVKLLQEKQDRVEELNRLSKNLQANLEHFREASKEQRLSEQQHHRQIQNQLEQTIKQLKEELIVLKQEKCAIQNEFENLRYAKDILQTEHTQLVKMNEVTQSRLDQADNELAQRIQGEKHWHNEYDRSKEKFEKQSTTLIDLQIQLGIVTQRYSDLQKELQGLIDQNKFLTSERWVLTQENAQLVGQLKRFEQLT